MKAKPFIFVCGPDEFLVNRLSATLFKEKVAHVADEFGREIVAGDAQTTGEVETAVVRFQQAVQTLPLFGDRKVVWLREVSFLADSKTGRAEETLRQVEILRAVLSSIDPDAVDVILSASPVDRRRKEFKWLQSNSDFHLVGGTGDSSAIIPVIRDECGKLGAVLSYDNAQLLSAKLNGNARLALEEVRKLATYLGSDAEEIKENHIAELVPSFGDGDFFEVAEAFFSLDLKWTLAAIRRHFFAGYDSRPLLTTLQGRNRLLIQLRSLMDAGALEIGPGGFTSRDALSKAAERFAQAFAGSEEKSNFNVFSQNTWYLGRIAAAARHTSLRKLMDWQGQFTRAFEELLSRSNQEQEEAIRSLALRCLT